MALQDVKVLELAGYAPAPFCGMILSDFGASVLRVDKVGSNTDIDCLAHGKKSIALNLKDPEGIKLFRKLCKSSDIILEPFRRGVMESLNLGPDVLMRDNPKLIYARLSGYGHSGSYSKKAGHDINYVALSGLLSLFGRKDQKPTFPTNLTADFAGGGLMCALGIVMALFEREKSGLGQIVDNNMVNGTAYLGSWLYRSQHLPIWGKKRGENIIDGGTHFYDVYETKDGKFISVGAIEPQFYDELLKGLNLTHETASQDNTSENIKQLFTETFKQKKMDEWLKIFENLDACVAPVLSIEEAPLFPHNVELNAFLKHGDNLYPAPTPKLSRTPAIETESRKPQRGEHTMLVLQELKYSDEEISELEKTGTIELYRSSKL